MFSSGFNQSTQGGQVESAPSLKQLHEITRTAPDHIVAQLVGHDRVHKFGTSSIKELRKYRLGGPAFNRTCFAILDGDIVHSAIYLHKGYDQLRSDRDFHGNVADILAHETAADGRMPRSVIFYSISNITNVPGAGQMLVSELHTHLCKTFERAKYSTLSPMRNFDLDFGDKDRQKFLTLPAPEQKMHALRYLLTGADETLCFHMGNGARMADVKLLSGDQSVHPVTGKMCQHTVMVNYAYDLSARELHANAASFRAVKQAIRNKDSDSNERKDIIVRGIFARVSGAILEDARWMDSDFSFASGAPALRF